MRLDALKNELPDLSILSIVRQVDMICHLWQQYVSIAILPLTSTSVTTRREFIIHNNQSVSKVEGATNTLLQKLTDGTSTIFSSGSINSTDSSYPGDVDCQIESAAKE
jgi:exocyst complex component 5